MGQGFLCSQVDIPGQANNFIMPFNVKLNNKIQSGDKLKFSYANSDFATGGTSRSYAYEDTTTQTLTALIGNKTLIPISLKNQAVVTLYNYQNALYATLETVTSKHNTAIQHLPIAANIDYTKAQAVAATQIINTNSIGILYITQNSSYINYCELEVKDDASSFSITKQRPTNIQANNIAAFDLVCKDQKQIFISWKNKDTEVAKIQHHMLVEDDGEYIFSTSGEISLSANTAELNKDNEYVLKMASHDGNVLNIICGGNKLYSNLVYFDAGILKYKTEKTITEDTLVIDRDHTQIKVFKDNLYAVVFKTIQNNKIIDFIKPIEATSSSLTLHYTVKLGEGDDVQPCTIATFPDYMVAIRSYLEYEDAVRTGFIGIVCKNKEFFITTSSYPYSRYSNEKPYLGPCVEIKGTNYIRRYATKGYGQLFQATAFKFSTELKYPLNNDYKKAPFVEVAQNEQSDIIAVTTGESGSTLEEKKQIFVSVPKEKLTPKVYVPYNITDLWDTTGTENSLKFSGNRITVVSDTEPIVIQEKTKFTPVIGHVYYVGISSCRIGNENTNFDIYFAQEQPILYGNATGASSSYWRAHGMVATCTKAQPLEIRFGNISKDGGVALEDTLILDLTALFGEDAAKDITDSNWLSRTLEYYYEYNKIYL